MSDAEDKLYLCILEARRNDAQRLLGEVLATEGYEAALKRLLEPTLRRVGERWAEDRISLAQGFVAGKVAQDFLALSAGAMASECPPPRTLVDDGGPPLIAVLGNIEDDYHALGRTMVASFLRLRGWDVRDLGADVAAETFVDRAVETGACVIGVSAMMLTTARNVAAVREVLEKRGLAASIKLAVGGAVFKLRPELTAEVGGDGTAGAALDAPELFERLRRATI